MRELSGVVPMLVTPLHDDGTVDLASLRRLVEFQIQSGAHGLAALGLAGEGTLLSPAERRGVAETVLQAVAGRRPVLVGITADTTALAIELGTHAREAGATAVMLAPSPRLASAEHLRAHYLTVAEQVRCPLMVQDAPGFLGVGLGIELVLRLARESAWVRAYKAEALPVWPNIRAAVEATGGQLPVFGGHGGLYLLDVLEAGGAGLIPGSDVTPRLVQIWEAYQAGQIEAARAGYTRLLPLLVFEAQSLALLVGGAKHLLRAAGIIRSAQSRLPGAELSASLIERLAVYAAWCQATPTPLRSA